MGYSRMEPTKILKIIQILPIFRIIFTIHEEEPRSDLMRYFLLISSESHFSTVFGGIFISSY